MAAVGARASDMMRDAIYYNRAVYVSVLQPRTNRWRPSSVSSLRVPQCVYKSSGACVVRA